MQRQQLILVAGLAIGVVILALVGAAFACSQFGAEPDTVATVNAVSTSVQQTLQARPPNVSAATFTPLPTTAAPPAPTNTAFAPPSPTSVSASPTPSGPLARPNGPVITAARRTGPVTVDADLNDWPERSLIADQPVYQPENWTGAGDHSVRYTLAWDDTHFYLAAEVTDDAHVQTERGETLFRGDSLEFLLDVDLGGDFASTELSGDDFQLGLSPGALSDDNDDAPEAYLWFPANRSGHAAGVTVAARRTDTGYVLEAAIPWSTFGVTPAASARFGFALSASDNDASNTAAQQSMISSVSTRELLDPTSWGTLELSP